MADFQVLRGDAAMAEALARIARETKERTGKLDLCDLALDVLPGPLLSLTHLHELRLGSSEPWTGRVPLPWIEEGLKRLSARPRITTLAVSGTNLTSLESIVGFTSLQRLECRTTWINDLTPLKRLTNLEYLECWGTQVSDLSPLAGLAGLQSLDCSETTVGSVAPLSGLTNLHYLNCSETDVRDLRPLAQIRALELGARANPESGGINFEGIPAIKGDRILESLCRLKNPERTIRTLAYLRDKAIDESEDEQQPTSEIEPQVASAVRFRIADGRIDVDERAGVEGLRTDQEARDRHQEVGRLARALLGRCDDAHSNRLGELREMVELLLAALGQDVAKTNPSILVMRCNSVRIELRADEERQSDPAEMEEAYPTSIRAGLRALVGSVNSLIALDPHLARLDQSHLDPDRAKSRPNVEETLRTAREAVSGGVAAAAVVDTLDQAARNAERGGAGAERLERFLDESSDNLWRITLQSVKATMRISVRGGVDLATAAGRGAADGLGLGKQELLRWFLDRVPYFKAWSRIHPALERVVEGLIEAAKKDVDQREEIKPAAKAPAGVRRAQPNSPAATPGADVGQPRQSDSKWYVSYAWNDRTAGGPERERIVDDLCVAAKARGIEILRDKDVLSVGERISAFMRQIGQGSRIFVILSDKYLTSAKCMFELSEIWRNAKQDETILLERVRVFTQGDARIWNPVDRIGYAGYWRKEFKAIEAAVQEHGLSSLGEKDHAAYRNMGRFHSQVSDILATFADTVQPRTFDELVKHGFQP